MAISPAHQAVPQSEIPAEAENKNLRRETDIPKESTAVVTGRQNPGSHLADVRLTSGMQRHALFPGHT